MALKKKYNPLVKLGFDLYNEVEIPDLTNYFYNRYSTGDKLPIIVEHDMGGIKMQDINGNSFLYVGDNGNLNIGGTSTLIKSGHKHSEYDVYKNEINLHGSEATFKQNGVLYLKSNFNADGIGTLEMPNVFLLNTGLENAETFNVLTYKQANGNPLIKSSTHPVSGGFLAYYGVNGAPLIVSDNESVCFLFAGDDEPFLKREPYKTTIESSFGEMNLVVGNSKIQINEGDEGFINSPFCFKINSRYIFLHSKYDYGPDGYISIEQGSIYMVTAGKVILSSDSYNDGIFHIGDQTTPNVDAIYLSDAGVAHLKSQLGLT
ncbi:MAG TPA: hypothetical protein PK984_04370 [Paludibacteraceae bacterium]|nr:hypothetical protein [Paludibacteraceae bacterium]HOS37431.1 hypothetical protein [Paludibacteraceae bacterium]HPK20363.1 hypothetical protein [Paludibacteraceae bacterium]